MVDPLTVTALAAAGAYGTTRGLDRVARRRYRAPTSPLGRSVVTSWTETADGWRLAVDHHRPAGPPRATVIMCPGLGVNRSFFDLTPEVSLARRLTRAGFEVFNCDLRGVGASAWMGPGAPPPFVFETHVEHDVPALIALALARSGAHRVHWVGHSMGGMLLLAWLASRPDERRIASGTIMCSPASFAEAHRQARLAMAAADRVSRVMRVPSSVWPWMAPLMPAVRFRTHLLDFGNFDGPVLRALLARSHERIETPLLRQFARYVRDDVWTAEDGFDFRAALGNVTAPLYFMAGAADRIAPPGSVESGWRAVASPLKRFDVFGVRTGHAIDYCHGGLACGRTAAVEVHPRVEGWLRERAVD